MNHFLIGQYGSFDYAKMEHDYRDDFFGIEACLFENEEDTLNLIQESKRRSFRIGIHFPLRAGQSDFRDAFFLAQDDMVRTAAYQLIQNELDYLRAVKPEYVLFHYPKPVILDDRVDWSKWHWQGRSEYEYESNYPIEEFVKRSEQLFEWLTVKSAEYQFVPVLEFDALNPYIYETDVLEDLLQKYNTIKFCLDTGRLFLQEKTDPFFSAKSVICKYAKYAEVIHLWNMQHTESFVKLRYPVLPEQRPEEGWAPIEEYLTIIREENRHVKIQFEHRSELVSDEKLEQCYRWVDQVLTAPSGLLQE